MTLSNKSRQEARQRQLSRLAGGCAALALAVSLTVPRAAHAQVTPGQATQGNPTVVSGSAAYNPGPNNDSFTIGSSEVIVNWDTFDTGTGGGTIDFLPAGNSLAYNGSADFVVLNRVIPNDPTRAIGFNGAVTSSVNGVQGGSVWFYSPGGIIVGSTGSFDVGGLVLTSNDIDTSGGLLGPNGEIRFRGAPDSQSRVIIDGDVSAFFETQGSNAAPGMGAAYIAVVAPSILVTPDGTVSTAGSTGYIAAEQADITINGGLFDINILAGTTVEESAIQHDGVTTGPASSGNGDPHNIYLVAMPKNTAVSMLVRGSLGYEPAMTAGVENGVVYLSAGGDENGNPVVADYTGNLLFGGLTSESSARGTITLDGSKVSSRIQGFASDEILVSDITGSSLFDRNAFFIAGSAIGLATNGGNGIQFGDGASLAVSNSVDGGRIDVSAINADIAVTGDFSIFAVGTIDGARGGTVNILASGPDISVTGGGLNIDAHGGNFTAGQGGDVRVTANNGSAIIADSISMFVTARGVTSGGNGNSPLGGSIAIDLNDASMSAASGLNLSARGIAGVGGTAAGGTIDVVLANGSEIYTDGNFGATVTSIGYFGSSPGSEASLGDGSNARVSILAVDSQINAQGLFLDANGTGGEGGAGFDGGAGIGGTAVLDIRGGALNAGSAGIYASGQGGDGSTGGNGTGGTASLFVSGGAQINVSGPLTVEAESYGGNAGAGGGNGGNADGAASLAEIRVDEASLTARNVFISSFAQGGNASDGGDGGSATGGQLVVSVQSAGPDAIFRTNTLYATASGFGGNGALEVGGGNGGDASSGPITFEVQGAGARFEQIDSAATMIELYSSAIAGRGGSSSDSAIAAGNGGTAIGSNILTDISDGGTLNFASMFSYVFAEGGLGGSYTGTGTGAGGTGGDGSSGSNQMSVTDAALAIESLGVYATATGGDGGASSAGPGGAGGAATAGSSMLTLSGSSVDATFDELIIGAVGNGGIGGDATGGAGGDGGDGSGGDVALTLNEGAHVAANSVIVSARGLSGAGGSGDTDGFGGTGRGGSASIFGARGDGTRNSELEANSIEVKAAAIAGERALDTSASPSGNAFGGMAAITTDSVDISYGSLIMSARGDTEDGMATGGLVSRTTAGGDQFGMSATLDAGASSGNGDATAGIIDITIADSEASGDIGQLFVESGQLLASAEAGGTGTATAGGVSIRNLTAAGDTLNFDSFDIVIEGDEAGAGLRLVNENGSIASGTGDFSITGSIVAVAGGDVTVGQAISATESIVFDADGAIDISETLDAGGAIMLSAADNLTTVDLQAVRSITAISSGGDLWIGNAESVGGIVRANAAGDLDTGNVRAAGSIYLSGGGAITAGDLTAGTGPLLESEQVIGGGGIDNAPAGIAGGFDDFAFERCLDCARGFLLPDGFTVNFFGTVYGQGFISDHGYITFDSLQNAFTPSGLGEGYNGQPIIAPFFADVDIRNPEAGSITYGAGNFAGRQAFGATWTNVGYYSFNADKQNTFQLVLTNRNDTGSGNFDIYFNYGSIGWETGDLSGGTNGLGGTSAAVGFNAGTGNQPGTFFELPGSRVPGSFIDGGTNPLQTVTNNGNPGQLLFTVRNGQVIVSDGLEAPTIHVSNLDATASGSDILLGNLSAEGVEVHGVGAVEVGHIDVSDLPDSDVEPDGLAFATVLDATSGLITGTIDSAGFVALGASQGDVTTGAINTADSVLVLADGSVMLESVGNSSHTAGNLFISSPSIVSNDPAFEGFAFTSLLSGDAFDPAILASASALPIGGEIVIGRSFVAGAQAAAAGNISLAGLTAIGNVTLTGATINLFGDLIGAEMFLASQDIEIGQEASVSGNSVVLTALNDDTAYVGGNDGNHDGFYSLDAGEIGSINAQLLSIGSERDILLETMTLNGRTSSGNGLGRVEIAGGSLVGVQGDVRFTNANAETSLFLSASGGVATARPNDIPDDISARGAIVVLAPSGSISITDAAGALTGQLELSANVIAVASESAIGALLDSDSVDEFEAILDNNEGETNEDGYIMAGQLRFNPGAGGLLFVQNSGASDGTDDRAGFTAGSGGIFINTEGGSQSPALVIINGRVVGADGTIATGGDVLDFIEFGDGQATVLPPSTANGCLILGGGCGAVLPMVPPETGGQQTIQAIADSSDDGTSGNTTSDGDTSLVTLADFEDPLEGPIIDDPVTSAGNEDFYLSTGSDFDAEGCAPDADGSVPAACDTGDEPAQ